MLTLGQRTKLHRSAKHADACNKLHADILTALAAIGASVVRVNGIPHVIRGGAKVAVPLLITGRDKYETWQD